MFFFLHKTFYTPATGNPLMWNLQGAANGSGNVDEFRGHGVPPPFARGSQHSLCHQRPEGLYPHREQIPERL